MRLVFYKENHIIMSNGLFNQSTVNSTFSFGVDKAIFYSVIGVFTMQLIGAIIQFPTFFFPVLNHILLPLGFFAGIFLAIMLLLVLLKTNSKPIISDLKHRFTFVQLILVVFIWLGFLPLGEFLTTLIPTTGLLEGLYQYFQATFTMLLKYKIASFIVICLMAPIFEEILFRGIILKGMLNHKINPLLAIVVSGLIFGVAHLNPWQFVGAGLLGCVFGYVYYQTKSLLLPIILHALNNTLSYVYIILFDAVEENIFDVSNGLMIGIFTILALILSYILHLKTKDN